MPRLLGERIQLREYQADDLESIRQWVNDESTTCFLSTAYWPPQTMVDTEEFLQRMLQSSHYAFNFVNADRESGRYLGQLDMFTVDWRLRCGKLGLVSAGAEYRGRGLGTEALRLLEKHVFLTLGLERLELEVRMDYAAARRCYERAGFRREGVKRHAFFANGAFCDVGIMSILREEYAR